MDNTSKLMLEKMDQIQSNLNTIAIQVNNLDAKVNSLEEKVINLDAKVNSLEEKVINLDIKVNNLEEKVTNLEIKVDTLISENQQEHARLDRRITKLFGENKEQHEELEERLSSIDRILIKIETEHEDKLQILFDESQFSKDNQKLFARELNRMSKIVDSQKFKRLVVGKN